MKNLILLIAIFVTYNAFAKSYTCYNTSRQSHIVIYNLDNLKSTKAYVRGFGYLKSEYENPYNISALVKNKVHLEFEGDVSYWGNKESKLSITLFGENGVNPIELIFNNKSIYVSFLFKNDQYYGDQLIEDIFCTHDAY